MKGRQKSDPQAAEVIPQEGLTNHKSIVARKRAIRQALINGLAVISFVGIFAACSTEDIKVSLILAIPSLIYLGLYVLANNI